MLILIHVYYQVKMKFFIDASFPDWFHIAGIQLLDLNVAWKCIFSTSKVNPAPPVPYIDIMLFLIDHVLLSKWTQIPYLIYLLLFVPSNKRRSPNIKLMLANVVGLASWDMPPFLNFDKKRPRPWNCKSSLWFAISTPIMLTMTKHGLKSVNQSMTLCYLDFIRLILDIM